MMARSQNRLCLATGLAAAFALLLAAGCDDQADAPTSTSGVHALPDDEEGSGGTTAVPDPGGGQIGGIIGRPPAGGAAAPPQTSGRIAFGGLVAPVPESWEHETPSSGMRAVQMRVPAPEGSNVDDAGFVVFTGIGGNVEQNIDRWVGQFTSDEDGGPVEPEIDTRTIGGLSITTVTLEGTYQSGMGPGPSGPEIMMIQSIVQRPSGEQYFVRLLGPTPTVGAHEDAFRAMLDGLMPSD